METICPTKNETSHTSWLRRLLTKSGAAPEATDLTTSEISLLPKQPANHQTVLVVDDDPLFLKLAATRLEIDGYTVITAKDGCEAIEAARKQKPNVVVLDVNLPQDVSGVSWDGFRVIEWMKRFDNLKNIPVVLVTGGDPSKCAREAIRAGATAFFHKRMDQIHLVTMVKQSLLRHRPTPAMGFDPNFTI